VFFFHLVAVGGTGPLLLVTAVGVCVLMPRAFCMLGCFLSFSGCGCWLSFGALGLLPAWGVRLLPLGHWVVALAFVLWRLFFGALALLLSLPLGGCGCRLSNDPLRLLLMVGVAFCASGLLLLLVLLVVLLSLSSSSLPFSFSMPRAALPEP
jgi:hypothetical protein